MGRVTATLECSICCNTNDSKLKGDTDWIVLVGCGHIFHSSCIRQWCSTTIPNTRGKKQNSCPYCKANIIHPGSDKSLSRFRRLIFGGDGGVVEKEGSSSSPARETAIRLQGVKRKRKVIEDDEDEEEPRQEGENGGATESESDEENSRPARRVSHNNERNRNNNNNNNVNNSATSTINAELQALLTTKSTRIAELEELLESRNQLLTLTSEQLESSKEEGDALEGRMLLLTTEKKKEEERNVRLREEKRGLTKSLKGEVEKVTKLKEQVGRLSVEMGTVKETLSDLTKKHADLQFSHQGLQSTQDKRNDAHDKHKRDIQRLLDVKSLYEQRNAKKKSRIEELEREVEELKKGRNEAIDRKGKGRALNEDANEVGEAGQEDNQLSHLNDSLAASASKTFASAKPAKPKRVYSLIDDEDDSLQIQEVSGDLLSDHGESEVEDFADLDAGFSVQQRAGGRKNALHITSASYSEKTATTGKASSKTVSRFFTSTSSTTSSSMTETSSVLNRTLVTKDGNKGGKESSTKKGSDKWTDMALGGNKNATGAKKRIKIGF